MTYLKAVLWQKLPPNAARDLKTLKNTFTAPLESTPRISVSIGGPATVNFLRELNSAEFLAFLETLTGIEGLIPDPYFEDGGIHETKPGGFLKVHTDFNYHKKLKLDRRVNLLIYLNDDWQEEFGGHIELWNTDMSKCVKRVLPIFNRMVIFNTDDFSYHGHPDPLKCPQDRTRKSLALYYYSNGRPASEVKFDRSTNTNYQARPEEEFDKKIKKSLGQKLKKRLGRLLR